MIKSVINFWIVLLFGGVAFGQCPTPSQVMKADRKNGWAENSQSKSGAVLTGEVYEYSFIVMGKFMKRQTNGNQQTREPSKNNLDSS